MIASGGQEVWGTAHGVWCCESQFSDSRDGPKGLLRLPAPRGWTPQKFLLRRFDE